MKKRFVVGIAIFLSSVGHLQAKTDPAAQEMLIRTFRQADLFGASKPPFVLDVDYTVKVGVHLQGHLQMRWHSKDTSWSKVTLGPFQQITIHHGEKVYTLRNAAYTPLPVADLNTLLHFAERPEELTAEKMKVRTDARGTLTCVHYQRTRYGREERETCIAADSRDIVNDASKVLYEVNQRVELAAYAPFDEIRFPRELTLVSNGIVEIAATVTRLQAEDFDEKLLVPLQGAIERRECQHMTPPTPTKTPNLDLDGQGEATTLTSISVTVLTDGTVGDTQIIGKSDPKLDQAIAKQLKTLKFNPAICGNEPVVSDIMFTISLHHD